MSFLPLSFAFVYDRSKKANKIRNSPIHPFDSRRSFRLLLYSVPPLSSFLSYRKREKNNHSVVDVKERVGGVGARKSMEKSFFFFSSSPSPVDTRTKGDIHSPRGIDPAARPARHTNPEGGRSSVLHLIRIWRGLSKASLSLPLRRNKNVWFSHRILFFFSCLPSLYTCM